MIPDHHTIIPPYIAISSYHHIIISSHHHIIISSYHIIPSYHTGMTHIPQKYENAFLLKTYRSYPLKVVIFRARFFKAQHAMVSNEKANLYFLGFVSSPHRDDPHPPKIRKRASAQNVSLIPLKSCHFSSSFF